VLNSPGTVDADYRGEIQVILINLGAAAFIISRAMRIAQLIVTPVQRLKLREVDVLDATVRAQRGFGSTGTN
jgi:dUTP pyrophosphatase